MTGLSVALALGATCVVSASAADLKPDAVVKTKSIGARVFLEDKLKADAALAANCLAEGKKWLDKNAAEAAASRKQDPQFWTAAGISSANMRSAPPSRIAMSASCATTTWTPMAPIPIRT